MESNKSNDDNVHSNKTVACIIAELVGEYVIVRTRNEGLNCGYLEVADNTGCVLKEARRLYRPISSDHDLSWYEGVAESGLDEKMSLISSTVRRKVIVEDYSITTVSSQARASLTNFVANKTTCKR